MPPIVAGIKGLPSPPQLPDVQESAVLLLPDVCCLGPERISEIYLVGLSWLSRVYRIFQIYSIFEPLS